MENEDRLTESRMTASWGGSEGEEGFRKKDSWSWTTVWRLLGGVAYKGNKWSWTTHTKD